MAGDFQASRVSLLESRAQFVAREVHVRLERRRAYPCPIRDVCPRLRGILEHIELVEAHAWRSLDKRRRRVHPRSNARAGVDRFLMLNLADAAYIAGRSYRSHPAGEIQPRERLDEIAG